MRNNTKMLLIVIVSSLAVELPQSILMMLTILQLYFQFEAVDPTLIAVLFSIRYGR